MGDGANGPRLADESRSGGGAVCVCKRRKRLDLVSRPSLLRRRFPPPPSPPPLPAPSSLGPPPRRAGEDLPKGPERRRRRAEGHAESGAGAPRARPGRGRPRRLRMTRAWEPSQAPASSVPAGAGFSPGLGRRLRVGLGRRRQRTVPASAGRRRQAGPHHSVLIPPETDGVGWPGPRAGAGDDFSALRRGASGRARGTPRPRPQAARARHGQTRCPSEESAKTQRARIKILR